MRHNIVISCEHASNRVPADLKHLFKHSRHLLDSHRGYDAGALDLAGHLARRLKAPLCVFKISRLVIDANRSQSHPRLFSVCMATATEAQKNRLLKQQYGPYREGLHARIGTMTGESCPVVHIAVHTFTPVLQGKQRTADMGLLYDPSRSTERCLAASWRTLLLAQDNNLRIRRNSPYKGTSDGITSWLRTFYPDRHYAGIELEINQLLFRQGPSQWAGTKQILAETARELFS